MPSTTATSSSKPPPAPEPPAQRASLTDEGNLLTDVSTRFMRMVATPPKEISQQVSEWTSHQTPAQGHVKVALASIDVDPSLYNGIAVEKVSSYGKFKHRIVTVAQDKFALFVTHERIKGSPLSHVAHKLPLPLFSRKHGFMGFSTKDYREQYVRYIDVADLQGVSHGVVDTQQLESSRTKNTRNKGLDSRVDTDRQDIVTIFHHGNRTLDVLVKNPNERKALVSTILQLVDTYHRVMEHVSSEARLLRYIWYDLDRNHDGHLDSSEFAKLLNRINLQPTTPPKQLFKEFKKSHHIHSRNITYRQCMDLLTQYQQGKLGGDASQTSIGLDIFNKTFGTSEDYVSASDFLSKFLQPLQHENDVSHKDVLALFESLNTMELNRDEASLPIKPGYLSKYRFGMFLHHSINNAYHPDELHLSQTLEKPMSQYWINTSHNTYLTGDQLQSYSSVECYMKALRRGCKCLELDCWDGEVNETTGKPIPVVFHGHTLTTKILFQDIIQVVHAYVQANPDTFPIILSLENHCSKPYQQVMATCLKETLGTSLYVPSEKDTKDGDLPSPKFLQGKVVIKGKRPPEPDDAPVGNLQGTSTDEDDDDDEVDPYSMAKVESGKSSTDVTATKQQEQHSSKILPELAQLTLFHGTKYKSFEQSIHAPPSYMHSIGESKITKIVEQGPENPGLWRMYNLHHMTRTYPAGARVDSSNYNPVLAWAMGCQMVALNFQTSDTPLLLNDGRFRQNGGCGYVLKPPAILGQADRAPGKTLKVRVLSGMCLPKPDGDTMGEVIDPYVTVTVHDVVTSDDGLQEFKTSSYSSAIIDNNGFHPVWNEKEFHSLSVEFPEVAMVHFKLMESDVTIDDKVADACVPFSCLRRGYRSIQLHDRYGTRTGPFSMATLLVEIDYE